MHIAKRESPEHSSQALVCDGMCIALLAQACDLWSMGILLYEMCSGDGSTPFHSDIPAVTYRKVLRGRMKMPAPP